MTASLNIHDAKTNFSKLMHRAEAGEEIIVRLGTEPVARIAPLQKKRGGITGCGSMKGEILIASDKEMKKVDEEIADLFEDGELFPGDNPHRART